MSRRAMGRVAKNIRSMGVDHGAALGRIGVIQIHHLEEYHDAKRDAITAWGDGRYSDAWSDKTWDAWYDRAQVLADARRQAERAGRVDVW